MMNRFNVNVHHSTMNMMILAIMAIVLYGSIVTAQLYSDCATGDSFTTCIVNLPSPLILEHASGPVQFGSESGLAISCLNDIQISVAVCTCTIIVDPGIELEDTDFCNSCILSDITATSITVADWDCSNRFVGDCVALASDNSCISNVAPNGNAPTVPPVSDPSTSSPIDPPLTITTPRPVAAPTNPPVTSTQRPVLAPTNPPFTTTQRPVPVPLPVAAPTNFPTDQPTPSPTDLPVATTQLPVPAPTDVPTSSPVVNIVGPDVPTGTANSQPVFVASPVKSPTIAKPVPSPTSDNDSPRDTSGSSTKDMNVVSIIFSMTIVHLAIAAFLM